MENSSSVSNHHGVTGRHPWEGMAGNLFFQAGMECLKMVGGVVCAALFTLIVGL